MATMEMPRERRRSGPSITIALPPAPLRPNRTPSIPSLPPSPLLRTRTAIDSVTGESSFVFPLPPTHEPEDGFLQASAAKKSPRISHISLPEDFAASYSPRPYGSDVDSLSISDRGSESCGRASAQSPRGDIDSAIGGQQPGEEEEQEELLEELADDQDVYAGGDADRCAPTESVANLVVATQAAAMTALQTLLGQMQIASPQPAEAEAGTDSQPSLKESLESAMADVQKAATKAERHVAMSKLNWLLDSLASDALVAGTSGAKNDGVSLANVLGDLLLSLENVRPDSDTASFELARTRQRSNSFSTINTTSSTGKDDLRDPFAENGQLDVFYNLHRLLTLLQAKTTTPSPSISARSSFQSAFSASAAPHGDHTGYPRRFESLDIPHSHLRTGSSSSLGHLSHLSPSSLSLTSAAALRLYADPEAWSHVGHISNLTRDLVVSRQQQQQEPGSPMHSQSHHNSMASSPHDVAADGSHPGSRTAARSSSSQDERTGSLARRSFPTNTATAVPLPGILKNRGSLGSLNVSSEGGQSLPPRYSEDDMRKSISSSMDHQIRDYKDRGLLPAYVSTDEKSTGHPASPWQRAWEDNIFLTSPTTSVAGETTASTSNSSDLQSLQNTLDRMAPQLTDQRVSPTTRKPAGLGVTASASNDRNLQGLIDQLSTTGKRLDDQRVEAPLTSPTALRDDEKAAGRSTQKQSILRKLSAAHLPGLKKATTASSKGKERSHSPSAQQMTALDPTPVTFPNMSESWHAVAPASGTVSTDRGLQSKRGTTLRSFLFASGMSENRNSRSPKTSVSPSHPHPPQPQVRHTRTTSADLDAPSIRSRYEEDIDLFELLAASSTRSRFADQEVVMRPGQSRNRFQSGSNVAESPTRPNAARDVNESASSTMAYSSADGTFSRLASRGSKMNGKQTKEELQDRSQSVGQADCSDADAHHSANDTGSADDANADEEDFLTGAARRQHQGSQKMAALMAS